MLKYNWTALWEHLLPSLEAFKGKVLGHYPELYGYVNRIDFGEVYFGAQLYFMHDSNHDEHELILFEIQVRSDVLPANLPPSLEFNSDDPGLVVLEIWMPGSGSLLRREAQIPSGATSYDIEQIAGAFFEKTINSMSEYVEIVLEALAAKIGSS